MEPSTHGLRSLTARLLLGCGSDGEHTIKNIESASGWTNLIDLCRRWKSLPQLRTRLAECGIRLPDESRVELQRLLTQSFVHTTNCIKGGTEAMEVLEARGIACAAFKGLASIAYLYPGAAHRTIQDVDILIREKDLQRSLETLEASGYKRSIEGSLDDYIAFVRNSPGSAGNEALSLTNGRGAPIDLHWKLGRLDTETLLGGRRRMTPMSGTVPVISPKHSILLTVHHALRNDFVADEMVRDLVDFSAWVGLHGKEEHPDLLPAAELWGLTGPVLGMDRILSRMRNISSVIPEAEAKPSDRRIAADLAELYFHQLEFGALNTDLIYLAAPRPAFQIMAGAASGWTRYRAMMKGMESINGEGSTLGERFRKFVGSAVRLPSTRWRQIRSLAAAKQGVV